MFAISDDAVLHLQRVKTYCYFSDLYYFTYGAFDNLHVWTVKIRVNIDKEKKIVVFEGRNKENYIFYKYV